MQRQVMMTRDPDAAALSAGDLFRIIVFGGIAIALCYAMAMYVVNLHASLATNADDIEVPEWFSFTLFYFFLLIFALFARFYALSRRQIASSCSIVLKEIVIWPVLPVWRMATLVPRASANFPSSARVSASSEEF